MNTDLANAIDNPWGFAFVFVVMLLPRVIARNRDPNAMRRFGPQRLALAYASAVVLALVAVALAEWMHLRPWVEATPVRGAVELMAVSQWSRYLFGGLIAWSFAAYLVAPVAAWLDSYSRANGVLVLIVSLPATLIIGACLSIAWARPLEKLSFTVTSAVCLVVAVGLGFSLGARLPMVVSLRSQNTD